MIEKFKLSVCVREKNVKQKYFKRYDHESSGKSKKGGKRKQKFYNNIRILKN